MKRAHREKYPTHVGGRQALAFKLLGKQSDFNRKKTPPTLAACMAHPWR